MVWDIHGISKTPRSSPNFTWNGTGTTAAAVPAVPNPSLLGQAALGYVPMQVSLPKSPKTDGFVFSTTVYPHRMDVWIYLRTFTSKNPPNVGKCTSPMDPMGSYGYGILESSIFVSFPVIVLGQPPGIGTQCLTTGPEGMAMGLAMTFLLWRWG